MIPTISEPLPCQPDTESIDSHAQLMSLDLADSANVDLRLPVDVLIGWTITRNLLLEACAVVKEAPHKTRAITEHCTVTTHSLRADSQPTCAHLSEQLRSVWELESLGILEEEKTLYDEFAATIRFQDGRYKVPLPWKEFHEPLGDNKQLCEKRLRGLLK